MTYAWNNRLIMALLVLSAIGSLFGRSYQTLLPVFSRLWNVGPQGYGLLLASAGAGALVGAFGLASVKNVSRHGAVMLVNGLLFSLSLIGFALSPSFWLGMVLLFIVGVTSTLFATIIATFIQVMIPNEMRGRVMSYYTVTLIGLPSLGALGSGAVAEWLGGLNGAPRAVLIAAILLGIILIFVTPVFWRRNIQRG